MKTETTHRSYKDLVSLKEYLVNQGSKVTFKFPNTLSNEDIKELKPKPSLMKVECSCTSWQIQEDLNQVTFIVKAPEYVVKFDEPQLKSTRATFISELGNKIIWDIKFYVNNIK